jgi:dihydroorotate dehydrogenase (fumarate)/dihydroorotate dehydrogenase
VLGVYETVVRPLLFRLDPERAHNLALRSCELAGRFDVVRRAARSAFGFRDDRLRVECGGLSFDNPLGLAAGFDKNGRAPALLGTLGFGHVEIGSVSAHPSQGNPRPRLFRIPEDGAIVVSYGVPNDGAEAISRRLDGGRTSVRLGINLVKTNDPARPAVEPDVYEDYARSFELLQGRADYIALNMSCPNSPGDRDFFDRLPRFDSLLARLAELSPRAPVFLKLKPTRDEGVLREIVAIADAYPFVAGFSINLPSGKPADLRLSTAPERLERMPGAVGGRPVEALVNDILSRLYGIVGPGSRYGLMAAGGVFSTADAYRKIRRGASLVQLYSGLVYRGPRLVREILTGLVGELERDGFADVADAVGVDSCA